MIANGFYEWQWLNLKGNAKQKYELCLPNEELFAFAGLYSNFIEINTGEIKNTNAIIDPQGNLLPKIGQ